MRLAGIQPKTLWCESGSLSGPLRCVPLGLRRARQGGERHPALRGRKKPPTVRSVWGQSIESGTSLPFWDIPAVAPRRKVPTGQGSPQTQEICLPRRPKPAGMSPCAGNAGLRWRQTGGMSRGERTSFTVRRAAWPRKPACPSAHPQPADNRCGSPASYIRTVLLSEWIRRSTAQ